MLKSPLISNGVLAVGEKNFVHEKDTKALLTVFIEQHKAGSPTQSGLYWIRLSPRELNHFFYEAHHIRVSNGLIKRLLKELGYKSRKMSKQLATGSYAQRDAQFTIIFNLVAIMSLESPIISIDCKKKERLGNLYRDGNCYATAAQEVYDHDYEHLAEGKVIPHGIYDLQANIGYVSIGASHETAEFIIDNLTWWWFEYGIHKYPDAQNILLLCDAGGGNSYRHHVFKQELLRLATKIGLSIIVTHYPPYASKWNPIEHRLFCHVHAAMSGAVLSDYNIVKQLIEKTYTQNGLKVIVRQNLKHYQKGIKGDKNVQYDKRIMKHSTIPELNYRIIPENV